jgi:hypothetical protein
MMRDEEYFKRTPEELEKLRKKLWNKNSVKNPIAKELLQGDGRLGAKINNKDKDLSKKPKYGAKEYLKELEEID